MAKTFQCSLVTPEEQLLDEQVTAAEVPAHDGQIGILPGRAPLLVQLGVGMLRLDFVEGGSRHFYVAGGFAQMKGDHLSLLTDEASPAENLVRSDAEKLMEEARQRKAANEQEMDRKEHDVNRARAQLHVFEKFGNRL